MAYLSEQGDCLCFRIVFCGPGCGGKSTALRHVHARLRTSRAGKLISLATETGRTHFFDFLPLNLGVIPEVGAAVRLHLYTAPGQSFYEEARRLILREADGVAFVADSEPGRGSANMDALFELRSGLSAWGRSLGEIPMTFFYNKRDIVDAVPLADLRETLNPDGRLEFEGVATTGQGVLPMMESLLEQVFSAHLAKAKE